MQSKNYTFVLLTERFPLHVADILHEPLEQ